MASPKNAALYATPHREVANRGQDYQKWFPLAIRPANAFAWSFVQIYRVQILRAAFRAIGIIDNIAFTRPYVAAFALRASVMQVHAATLLRRSRTRSNACSSVS